MKVMNPMTPYLELFDNEREIIAAVNVNLTT